jgi:hypothetical protein
VDRGRRCKGPQLSGYVYNTTNRRAMRMRLAIDGLDPAGHVMAHTETWVLGSVPPSNRAYFETRVPPAAAYRVAVLASTGWKTNFQVGEVADPDLIRRRGQAIELAVEDARKEPVQPGHAAIELQRAGAEARLAQEPTDAPAAHPHARGGEGAVDPGLPYVPPLRMKMAWICSSRVASWRVRALGPRWRHA